MKAAWALQGSSTIFYIIFSVVIYVYLGSTVQSPALLSLPPVWAKITFAIGMVNFLMYAHGYTAASGHRYSHYCSAGALYAHTAAKILFMRIFRGTHHIRSHTLLGWAVWATLCFVAVAVAFVLAAAVPIFSDLTGIAASLFAAWFTYGIAGFFWLHDTYHLGEKMRELKRRKIGTTLALLTILAGTFICIAGTYVSIKVRPFVQLLI